MQQNARSHRWIRFARVFSCLSAMDIEERIEIRADLIYTGILDAVERLKNQSVDVFMEQVGVIIHIKTYSGTRARTCVASG